MSAATIFAICAFVTKHLTTTIVLRGALDVSSGCKLALADMTRAACFFLRRVAAFWVKRYAFSCVCGEAVTMCDDHLFVDTCLAVVCEVRERVTS
jgi:hypothetical protein